VNRYLARPNVDPRFLTDTSTRIEVRGAEEVFWTRQEAAKEVLASNREQIVFLAAAKKGGQEYFRVYEPVQPNVGNQKNETISIS
jgi:hypothetical protein